MARGYPFYYERSLAYDLSLRPRKATVGGRLDLHGVGDPLNACVQGVFCE